ncbi:MAG: tRNA (adenosine(37)-N6)-threonylcarbamoyltransferase complex dimerization subunit type 1 TsaB [Alphaproteobacteria bacterium]
MSILFIDTNFGLSIATVVDHEKNCFKSSNNSKLRQSETIASVVKEVLNKSNKSIDDISSLMVTNGPGNFTSIRVGISFALGLAKGINKPVYSLSSLEFLSFFDDKKLLKRKEIIALLPSRGNEFFIQAFCGKGKNLTGIEKINKTDIENKFSPDKFIISKSSLHNEYGLGNKYEIFDRTFEELSIIIASEILSKSDKVNRFKKINYFSDPSAEKVSSSWYMKKKS